MQLYKYMLSNTTILRETIEVDEKEKTYTLISNPHIRISKSKIDKVDPEDNVLYSLTDDLSHAAKLYSSMLSNQILAFENTIKTLKERKKAIELFCK